MYSLWHSFNQSPLKHCQVSCLTKCLFMISVEISDERRSGGIVSRKVTGLTSTVEPCRLTACPLHSWCGYKNCLCSNWLVLWKNAYLSASLVGTGWCLGSWRDRGWDKIWPLRWKLAKILNLTLVERRSLEIKILHENCLNLFLKEIWITSETKYLIFLSSFFFFHEALQKSLLSHLTSSTARCECYHIILL